MTVMKDERRCPAMRKSRQPPLGRFSRVPAAPPLSPRRAFVVQFREDMDATPPCLTGRVEHIVSGHAARFHSPEELWAFFTQILADVHEGKEVIP
jgi:hypothetical protein